MSIYHLELSETELKIIKYARFCLEHIFDLKGEIYPNHQYVDIIAKLARILEFKGEKPDMMRCSNCFYWKFNNPEANGESTGICESLSYREDDYFSVLSVRVDSHDKRYLEKIAVYTRSSFMCSKFSRKNDKE